jgi:hypothetical protein
VGNPVEDNLPRGSLDALNRVLLRFSIQEDVQFRNFCNPTTIDLMIQLDRELHSQSLSPGSQLLIHASSEVDRVHMLGSLVGASTVLNLR